MDFKYDEKDKLLTIEFTEEIDHHVVEKIRRKMDYEIERFIPRKTILDFNKVTFMDSAGIGLVIGRYKTIKMYGGAVEIINANSGIKKIFEMCGIPKIMKVS